MKKISGYVTRIDKELVVIVEDMQSSGRLLQLGFSVGSEKNSFLISLKNDQEKYFLIEKLRDEGFAFSGGSGWSPSEVVDFLRDQGYVSGKYLRISWQYPGSYIIDCI